MNAQDKAFRDQVAITVMSICVGDLSRQITGGAMPMIDVPKAIEAITALAYSTADAMLKARSRK